MEGAGSAGGRAAFVNQEALPSEGPLPQAYSGQLAGTPEPFAGCSAAGSGPAPQPTSRIRRPVTSPARVAGRS